MSKMINAVNVEMLWLHYDTEHTHRIESENVITDTLYLTSFADTNSEH